jgi:hypothetical protein
MGTRLPSEAAGHLRLAARLPRSVDCVFALHRLDAIGEGVRQFVKWSRERKAGVYSAAVSSVAGVEEIAILVPMLDGELHLVIGSREPHLVSESSFEQGSSWRFGIPGHQDGRRNRLWFAYDVLALWGATAEEMRMEELKFPAVERPVGRCQVLKSSPHRHRWTVPRLLCVVQPVRVRYTA